MFVVVGRGRRSQRWSGFCIRLAFYSQHDGYFLSIPMFLLPPWSRAPGVSLSGRRARMSRPLHSASRPAAARRAAWPNVSNWHLRRSWVRDSFVNIWLLWCSAQGVNTLPACPKAKSRGSRRFTEPELWHTQVLLSLLTAHEERLGFGLLLDRRRRHFGLWDAVIN